MTQDSSPHSPTSAKPAPVPLSLLFGPDLFDMAPPHDHQDTETPMNEKEDLQDANAWPELPNIPIEFADEDGFDFTAHLGNIPPNPAIPTAQETAQDTNPVDRGLVDSLLPQGLPIDPRLVDLETRFEQPMEAALDFPQVDMAVHHHASVGNPKSFAHTYAPQPQFNITQPYLYSHPAPNHYPFVDPQNQLLYAPQPFPTSNSCRSAHYQHTHAPYRLQYSHTHAPYRLQYSQQPPMLPAARHMLPENTPYYAGNANMTWVQGVDPSSKHENQGRRKALLQGQKSTGSSPSYFSGSEFEFCPDSHTEGLPDTRGWRFISGNKIPGSRKISTSAKLKQLSRCYRTQLPTPPSWGQLGPHSKPLFTYTKDGRWASGRKYNATQLRHYIENCPRQLFIWIQQCPAQSNWRMDADDNLCRWDKCPVRTRKISPGWLRVAFDEFGMETSTGIKDPYKVAGTMHLWCFEQCFDIVEFYSAGKLFADLRNFPLEELNRMSLARDMDREIMDEAFRPWFREQLLPGTVAPWMPLKHEDTLSYTLVEHHLKAQAGARQSTRATRNAARPKGDWKTLDVHMGNLGLYAGISARRVRGLLPEVLLVQEPIKMTDEKETQLSSPVSLKSEIDLHHELFDAQSLEDVFGTDWQEQYRDFFVDGKENHTIPTHINPGAYQQLLNADAGEVAIEPAEGTLTDRADSPSCQVVVADDEQVSPRSPNSRKRTRTATGNIDEEEHVSKRARVFDA